MEEIKANACKIKVSKRSYKLANEKIRKDILQIISQMDTKKNSRLTFDTIGKIMGIIGIFQMSYNQKADLNKRSQSNSDFIKMKREKEKSFQIALWRMLKDQYQNFVDSKKLVEVLVILFDSHYLPSSSLMENLSSTFIVIEE